MGIFLTIDGHLFFNERNFGIRTNFFVLRKKETKCIVQRNEIDGFFKRTRKNFGLFTERTIVFFTE